MDEFARLHDDELLQARAARRQRTLALLARDLVHDFRNTLGAIVAFVDIAAREGSDANLDPRLVQRSGESLDRGIRMLDLVAHHAFRQETETRAVSLASFVADLAVMLESYARRRGVVLHAECAKEHSIAIDQRAVRDLVVRIALREIATCGEGATMRLVVDDEPALGAGDLVTLRLCLDGRLDGSPTRDAELQQLLAQNIDTLDGADDFAQSIADGRMALTLCGGGLRYESEGGVRSFLLDLPIAIASGEA